MIPQASVYRNSSDRLETDSRPSRPASPYLRLRIIDNVFTALIFFSICQSAMDEGPLFIDGASVLLIDISTFSVLAKWQ